eukprot:Lithocolla_globosa_v1_NODE_769_length_3313_cov_85.298956.p1 type:complete len:961 gc:universal NODE_769_length_3313_cov_85.298956:2905-23(-)
MCSWMTCTDCSSGGSPIPSKRKKKKKMQVSGVKVATKTDKVYREECCFSFDTPLSPDGLFVNLSSFRGYGKNFVEMDHQKTGNALYLHLKRTLKPKEEAATSEDGPPKKKIKHLAIGVEGGFEVDQPREFDETRTIVQLPGWQVFEITTETPEIVRLAVDAIVNSESIGTEEDPAAWMAEPRVESKFSSTLEQLDNGVKIPPSGWKCSMCDLKENLWLNLSDGTLLCGRKNWDGTGGNGHALEHFEKTKFPLCVKLATISPEGADIFSYAEDDMVLDSELPKHLLHFGINMMNQEKTEKTIAEMELDQNMSYEISIGTKEDWMAEPRVESKFSSTLEQLDNGVKIPPSGWKCSMCDLKENLWLNLSDGTLLCGRKNWDGTGGNGHALEHFEKTKFPLCVKLATISPEGADIFSYAEDDMVLDSELPKHLLHFGINMMNQEKTEKTIAEMELDQNMSYEFNRLQESGKQLEIKSGPGFVGLKNLGNSCYLASVMQVLFRIKDFQKIYVEDYNLLFSCFNDPFNDFNTQMAKLGQGLLNRPYSTVGNYPSGEDNDGIPPRSFKSIIGRGHPDFSSMRQQDAHEFYTHLLTQVERANQRRALAFDPIKSLTFALETRLHDHQSNHYRYMSNSISENALSLPVPLSTSTSSQKDQDGKSRPIVFLKECLNQYFCEENIEDFLSPMTNQKGTASKRARMKNFPPYLMVHLKKFYYDNSWNPKKIDVHIGMPEDDIIDLSTFRAQGPQPEEKLLAEEISTTLPTEKPLEIDMEIVKQLTELGFGYEGCRRAVFNTKNAGVEAATNWVLEHMGDPDFESPFVPPSSNPSSGGGGNKTSTTPQPKEEDIEQLLGMGFDRERSKMALLKTDNNVERAVDWLFSHPDEEITPMEQDETPAAKDQETLQDGGDGKYKLKAFISHMGTSAACGHYVAHINIGEEWVLFNDNHVAVSQNVPKDMAYMYLYERI